jgi:hypothetical protein
MPLRNRALDKENVARLSFWLPVYSWYRLYSYAFSFNACLYFLVENGSFLGQRREYVDFDLVVLSGYHPFGYDKEDVGRSAASCQT